MLSYLLMTMIHQWMSGSSLEVLQLRRDRDELGVLNFFHDQRKVQRAQVGDLDNPLEKL